MLTRPTRNMVNGQSVAVQPNGNQHSNPGSVFSIQNLLRRASCGDSQEPQGPNISQSSLLSKDTGRPIRNNTPKFNVSSFVGSDSLRQQTGACPVLMTSRNGQTQIDSNCKSAMQNEPMQSPEWLHVLLDLVHRRESQRTSHSVIINELARLIASKDVDEFPSTRMPASDGRISNSSDLTKSISGSFVPFMAANEEECGTKVVTTPNRHGQNVCGESLQECSPNGLFPFMLQTTGKHMHLTSGKCWSNRQVSHA